MTSPIVMSVRDLEQALEQGLITREEFLSMVIYMTETRQGGVN